jgi:hypothetical protein
MRNALINNLNPLNLRQDTGALWENFLISERMKRNNNLQEEKNVYFWRTRQKQEIDYLEEYQGELSAYEFKWSKDKFRKPKSFLEAYPKSSIEAINKSNYKDFLMR